MIQDRIKRFLIWMRNGVSMSFTWLTLLLLIIGMVCGIDKIPLLAFVRLLAFVTGSVFLFTLMFSDIVIRKLQFVGRLTVFTLLFSVYEGVCFYYYGLFHGNGRFIQWLIFSGIIVILYFVCIGIFQIYSRKKGEEYTEALQKYQQEQKNKEKRNERK